MGTVREDPVELEKRIWGEECRRLAFLIDLRNAEIKPGFNACEESKGKEEKDLVQRAQRAEYGVHREKPSEDGKVKTEK